MYHNPGLPTLKLNLISILPNTKVKLGIYINSMFLR